MLHIPLVQILLNEKYLNGLTDTYGGLIKSFLGRAQHIRVNMDKEKQGKQDI